MARITVSSKGQIAIPKSLRERLNLRAGTKMAIDVQGESLVLKRVTEFSGDWRAMRGMTRNGSSFTQALMEERTADRAHDESRIKSS